MEFLRIFVVFGTQILNWFIALLPFFFQVDDCYEYADSSSCAS